MSYYKCEIRSIDAWREPEGGWSWNDSYLLEKDVFFHESALNSRQILRYLRERGYLTSFSKGKVRVSHEWPLYEIQDKNSDKPLLALIFEEREYKGAE